MPSLCPRLQWIHLFSTGRPQAGLPACNSHGAWFQRLIRFICVCRSIVAADTYGGTGAITARNAHVKISESCHDAGSRPAAAVLCEVHENPAQMCGHLQPARTPRLVVVHGGQELQRNDRALAGTVLGQAGWRFLQWQGSRSAFRCSRGHGGPNVAEQQPRQALPSREHRPTQ